MHGESFVSEFCLSVGSSDFDELQRRFGYSYDPHLRVRLSILRPLETTHFDYMHVLYVGGVFQVHAMLFLKGLNLKAKAHQFASLPWKFPRQFGEFKPAEALVVALSKTDKFGCSASDGMTLLMLFVRLRLSLSCLVAESFQDTASDRKLVHLLKARENQRLTQWVTVDFRLCAWAC